MLPSGRPFFVSTGKMPIPRHFFVSTGQMPNPRPNAKSASNHRWTKSGTIVPVTPTIATDAKRLASLMTQQLGFLTQLIGVDKFSHLL